ncbi:MAG: hypothetical protein JWO86_8995, partial [Myxococcaceae bacterium]|nr:hypothetical protein [Myxococcaceae bacterium]
APANAVERAQTAACLRTRRMPSIRFVRAYHCGPFSQTVRTLARARSGCRVLLDRNDVAPSRAPIEVARATHALQRRAHSPPPARVPPAPPSDPQLRRAIPSSAERSPSTAERSPSSAERSPTSSSFAPSGPRADGKGGSAMTYGFQGLRAGDAGGHALRNASTDPRLPCRSSTSSRLKTRFAMAKLTLGERRRATSRCSSVSAARVSRRRWRRSDSPTPISRRDGRSSGARWCPR